MTEPAHRIERGRRAAAALEEFLDPAFDEAISLYTHRMREIVAREPWELEKIKALVMAGCDPGRAGREPADGEAKGAGDLIDRGFPEE